MLVCISYVLNGNRIEYVYVKKGDTVSCVTIDCLPASYYSIIIATVCVCVCVCVCVQEEEYHIHTVQYSTAQHSTGYTSHNICCTIWLCNRLAMLCYPKYQLVVMMIS